MTDIKNNSIIIRILPAFLRPYALLMRLDRPIGTWLLLLPAWWAIAMAMGGVFKINLHDLWLFFLFGIGAIIMRGAGCVINDLWDRDLDKKVERTAQRPIAGGAVSKPMALVFLGLLLLLGAVILFQLSFVAIIMGFCAIPMIILYPLMKRITYWPQLFLGLTFNFGALMGWAAVDGTVSLSALLLYISGVFWTLGYDTIYAHQDIEDDMKAGIKSSAIKLGSQSHKIIRIFYSAFFALLTLAFILSGAGILSCLFLVLAAAHSYWLLGRWDAQNPRSALQAFKANRDTGLLILLAALLI